MNFFSFSDELQKIAKKVSLPNASVLFRTLEKGSPVKIRVTPEAKAYGGGFFDQVKKEIGITEKDYETLAHEIGHAELDQHLLGQLIQSRAMRLMSHGGPSNLIALGAGLLMAKGKNWGLLLPAAVAVPTLLSEGLASYKGHKLLREAGASEKQLKKYKGSMGSNFATYLRGPILSTAIAGVIGTS